MKVRLKKEFLLALLVASLGLLSPFRVTAQTCTNIYNFNGGNDGASPYGGLILSGNRLFGTTYYRGSAGNGTIFAVNTDGTGFTNLYGFDAEGDGANPFPGLVLSGNILYGTTFHGGSSGNGTVFAIHTDGMGFTNLYSFTATNNSTNGDGANPRTGLILSGDMLYGTTEFGGASGAGAIYGLRTDGTGFTNLYSFSAASAPGYSNSDGAYPFARLLLSGDTLYGATYQGGAGGNGILFAVKTDGTGFTNLHSFTAGTGSWPFVTNADGANPAAGLILSGNTLYGETYTGGNGGAGAVFAIGTDGTGFTNLHEFTGTGYSELIGNFTNSDGYSPAGGLILVGDTLYGSASGGGMSGAGTVFAVNATGASFSILHSFAGGNDGQSPFAFGGLVFSGNTLYGTTSIFGAGGSGTVFSLSLPLPQLNIILSGTNVVLAWPADVTGFTLQSTTNLGATASWSAVANAPVVVNGQNTVTNPVSGAQQFYRLSQ